MNDGKPENTPRNGDGKLAHDSGARRGTADQPIDTASVQEGGAVSATPASARDVAVAPAGRQELSQGEINQRLMERRALTISKGDEAVPKAFRGRPADICAVWLMAAELGIGEMQALRSMYVVNGKPQLSGDLMLALAYQSGCKIRETFHNVVPITDTEEDGTEIEADPSQTFARCEVVRPDGQEVVAEFSVLDAMNAKLWQSSDPWRKYPARMLKMRARGFALRDAIPEILAGLYVEGELIDLEAN